MMLGDHMTKGLQGVEFSVFRRRIVGMDPEPLPGSKDECGLLKQ